MQNCSQPLGALIAAPSAAKMAGRARKACAGIEANRSAVVKCAAIALRIYCLVGPRGLLAPSLVDTIPISPAFWGVLARTFCDPAKRLPQIERM